MCLILHHTGVCRHIGEEHKRQTTGEETCTSPEAEALVGEDIPLETHSRRNCNIGIRPLACVDMTLLIVVFLRIVCKVIYLVVSCKILVVEEQTVKTQTVSELEIVNRCPFVLSIDSELVELNPCCRCLFTVVTVSEADNFRSSAVDEVVNA